MSHQFLRSISVPFDARDLKWTCELRETILESRRIAQGKSRFDIEDDLQAQMHSYLVEDLTDRWRVKTICISRMTLDFLQINLRNAHCPLGCHRLVNELLQLRPWLNVSKNPPKVIEVLGTVDEKERSAVKKAWDFGTELRLHEAVE